MKHEVTSALIDEARRYRLVFACGECAHHDDQHGSCSLGLPDESRVQAPLRPGDSVSFCRYFELG